MSQVVTYRIEEWSVQTGQVLGTYGRHTLDRDEALFLWASLVGLDAVCQALFGPHGTRRLVLVAEPRDGAALNAAARADRLAALRASVAMAGAGVR